MLSWIILDYDSNTIGYDKKNGLRGANCKDGIITINHRGRIFVDFKRDDSSREIIFDSSIEDGVMNPLDQRLWLEGNLSIGYGRSLNGTSEDIFSLRFEPCEVEKALDIPIEDVNIEVNSWFVGLFEEKPSKIACFPYAQHFVSDSPGYTSRINNREELEKSIRDIDFSKIEVFNTKAMKVMFLVGMGMSFLITVVIIVLLIIK